MTTQHRLLVIVMILGSLTTVSPFSIDLSAVFLIFASARLALLRIFRGGEPQTRVKRWVLE